MAISAKTVSIDRAEPVPLARTRQRRSQRQPAAFLLLMTIFPTIYSLWMSVQQYNLSRPDLIHFVGLRNYGQLLTDDIFWKAIRVTAVFSVAVLVIEFTLGFFIANLFDRERRGMTVLRTLFIIPVFA